MSDPVTDLILGFDRALRTLTGQTVGQQTSPAAEIPDVVMSEEQQAHAAGLMRVNHTGEICAQALYEGQALTARSASLKETLLQAAEEERDHLHWCRERLGELESRPSVLDPVFYAASFVMGAATGLAGDKISLGFVEATEDQVVEHLDRHLEELPGEDLKSRAIVEQMREDEARHGAQALDKGGVPLPAGVRSVMTLVSKVMTETTYKV